MKIFLKWPLGALLAIQLVGCNPVGGSGSEGPAGTSAERPQTLDDRTTVTKLDPIDKSDLHIITTKTYEDNSLKVNFKPNNSDIKILSVRRVNVDDPMAADVIHEIQVIDSSEVVDLIEDQDPLDIDPFRYNYELIVSHPSLSSSQSIIVEVQQHKDLLIRGHVSLKFLKTRSNNIYLRNLKIESGALFTIDKPSVKIFVQNLESEVGAMIENMSSKRASTSIAEATQGQDGGSIFIDAAKANGTLKISLRGQVGGPGAPGAPSPEQGSQGAPGRPGVKQLRRRSPFPKQPVSYVQYASFDSEYYCKTPPGDGEKGHTGGKGGSGSRGAKGGDTGSFQINVDAGQLEYSVEMQPGPGGEGGHGGSGGPGGPGGAPGDNADGECPDAQRGPTGDTGPQGDSGAKGEDGELGMFCAFKKNSNANCQSNNSFTGVIK